MPGPAVELSIVSEDDPETPSIDPVDAERFAARSRELGELVAFHREAADRARQELDALAQHTFELRERSVTANRRELKYRELALAKREQDLAQKEREFENQRRAFDGLKSALGIAGGCQDLPPRSSGRPGDGERRSRGGHPPAPPLGPRWLVIPARAIVLAGRPWRGG